MFSGHTYKYRAYLQSPEWRMRRRRKLEQAGWECEACGASQYVYGTVLQVHHKTYERLGRELDSDLEVLCTECHEIADQDRREQNRWRARVEGFARKKWGEYWNDHHTFEEAQSALNDYLAYIGEL